MIDIKDFVGIGGAPFVQFLVEQTKKTFPTLRPRWYPAISMLWGIILNVALGLILKSDLPVAIVVGVVTGAIASGSFAWGKRTEVK